MSPSIRTLLLCSFFIILIGGCSTHTGEMYIYPPTDRSSATFQAEALDPQCQVFSHLLVQTPAGATGKEIADDIIAHAKANGADQILLGIAKTAGDNKVFSYNFYGPSRKYLFRKEWQGWKFGFSTWKSAGNIVHFDTSTWGNPDQIYNNSILLQAVYLRCHKFP